MIKVKKPAKKISIRKRFLALTSNERVKGNILLRSTYALLNQLKNKRLSRELQMKGLRLTKLMFASYIYLMSEPTVDIERSRDKKRSIDSFTPTQCWNYFETRKEDLPRLVKALQFPEFCILPIGIKMSGEKSY